MREWSLHPAAIWSSDNVSFVGLPCHFVLAVMPSGQGQVGSRSFDGERVIFYERRGDFRHAMPLKRQKIPPTPKRLSPLSPYRKGDCG
jgi:hypothetical protein